MYRATCPCSAAISPWCHPCRHARQSEKPMSIWRCGYGETYSSRQMSMSKPVGPNTATATPLGPPRAQTAQKQHAGLLELDAQPSVASIRLPEGAAPNVSAPGAGAASSHPDTYAASGPEPGTWKDPDPRRRSSRGPGAQNRPACAALAATRRLRPVPSQRFLALWCQATRRLVADRSRRPRSAWPDQARLALLAVTHR